MGLPLPTPKPPAPDEYVGIESLDRPELDDAPDTERTPQLPALDWENDSESGVVKKRSALREAPHA